MQLVTALILGSVLSFSLLGQASIRSQDAFMPFLLVFAALSCLGVFATLLAGDTVVRLGFWPTLLLPHFTLSLAALSLVAVQSMLLMQVPHLLSFPMLTALLLVLTLSVHEANARVLQLEAAEKMTLAFVGVIWIGMAAAWEARSLGLRGIEEPTVRLAAWSSLYLLLYPLTFWLVHSLGTIQGKKASVPLRDRIRMLSRKHPERLLLLGLHWGIAFCNYVLLQWVDTQDQIWYGSRLSWACLSLQVLPGLFWALRCWQEAHRLPRSIRSQSVPDTSKAAHLIGQHHYGEEASQETWLGFRSAVLMVDHDPNEECKTYLPSLLYRARQLQCEQIMRQIFGEKITSLNASSSQITVALDPEKTLSSCTDALLTLTVLYLDGLPLVERRLNNLVRMLSLLDPQLASSLSETRLEALFGRLQSFFHLDFNWIDQSMQSSSSEANIEIRLENLNPKERQRVLAQLSEAQWLGNFIWISEAAREQLRCESPFLSSTVERWPIQIEQGGGRTLETVIFLIKFENLIPRLQRYFGLDEVRGMLAPRPISSSTQLLVDRLQEQIPQQKDFAGLKTQLEALAANRWQGYRAKDLALDLVLRLVKQAKSLAESVELSPEQLSSLEKEAREIVQEIGYPSQELHAAHLKKMALRQISELQRICLDINHPRCYEAWLLLGTLPVRKMGQDAAAQLLQLVAFVSRTRQLRRDDFILKKAIEAYFQLVRILSSTHESEMQRILNMLASAVIDSEPDAGLLLSFMDKKLALDAHRGQVLPLNPQILSAWETQLGATLRRPGLSNSLQSAVQLRWKAFSQNQETRLSQNPIAS